MNFGFYTGHPDSPAFSPAGRQDGGATGIPVSRWKLV